MERPISGMASMVNEIPAFVRRGAQGMEIGEGERHLLSLVLAVGRGALEEFVAEKRIGYAGKGIWMHRVTGTRRSVRGTVRIVPSSERSPSGELTITLPVHLGAFFQMAS